VKKTNFEKPAPVVAIRKKGKKGPVYAQDKTTTFELTFFSDGRMSIYR